MNKTMRLSVAIAALLIPATVVNAQACDKGGKGGGKHHGPLFTFEEADANSDGFLTQTEIDTAKEAAKKKKQEERFKSIDEDGDGKLSKAEWDSIKEKMKERFDKKDGKHGEHGGPQGGPPPEGPEDE